VKHESLEAVAGRDGAVEVEGGDGARCGWHR
jgi:hypothetical protein